MTNATKKADWMIEDVAAMVREAQHEPLCKQSTRNAGKTPTSRRVLASSFDEALTLGAEARREARFFV